MKSNNLKNSLQSAGETTLYTANGDPLLPHSQALVAKLNSLNVKVDSLFFKKDHIPALPHEYQFNLDTPEGMLALKNSVSFSKRITNKKH